MNYQKIYNQIIQKAQSRELNEYVERHHIIPKCMGGGNQKTNIVKLTAREHFICHSLLCSIHSTNVSLKRAYWLMANRVSSSIQERRYKISAREYDRIRKEFSKINSEFMMGNKFWVGRYHTEETKLKMSEVEVSDETRKKMSISAKKRGCNNINRTYTKEQRHLIGLKSGKPIIEIATGIEYPSAVEASKHCNIASSNISNHLRGKYKKQRFKYK